MARGVVDRHPLQVHAVGAEQAQARFVHEALQDGPGLLGIAHGPAHFRREVHQAEVAISLRTAASKSSALKGLTIQPLAPARLARSMSDSCPSLVSITTGNAALRLSCLMVSSISSPFTRGMLTSKITIPISRSAATLDVPSAPSLASTTSKPASRSTVPTCWRTVGESSTTKTRFMA